MSITRPIRAVTVAAAALLLGGCIVATHEVHASPPPELSTGVYATFYDDLAPYGQWMNVHAYGWVWHPYGVPRDWRPYTYGHWVLTDDYGWTWVSDWDWGWAPFHYGRWAYDPDWGWVWLPGETWGPAWVAWRYGPGWIGWAPLPPQVIWQPGVGVVYAGGDIALIIPASYWCFVPERRFLSPRLHVVVVRSRRNARLIRTTGFHTGYGMRGHHAVNRGLPVDRVSRAVGRSVPRYRVREAERAPRGRAARIEGNEVRIYRPAPRARPAPARPAPPRAAPARPAPRPHVEPRREAPRAVPARPAPTRPSPGGRVMPPRTQPRAAPARPAPAHPAPGGRVMPPRTPPRAAPAKQAPKKGDKAKGDKGKQEKKGDREHRERRGQPARR